jgi:hypothetical protein
MTRSHTTAFCEAAARRWSTRRIRVAARAAILQDQPIADLPLESIGALSAVMLQGMEHSPQHALVMRVPERNALEFSDRLALQRPAQPQKPIPASRSRTRTATPTPTPYNLIDYFRRRPHRTLTDMAQHWTGCAHWLVAIPRASEL